MAKGRKHKQKQRQQSTTPITPEQQDALQKEKSLEQRYYEEFLEHMTQEIEHPTETIERVRLLLDELTMLVGNRVIGLSKKEAHTEEEETDLTKDTALLCKLAPMTLRYAEKELVLKSKHPYEKLKAKLLPNPSDMLGYERYIQKRIRRFVHENGLISMETAEEMRQTILALEEALAKERGVEIAPPGSSIQEQFEAWKATQPKGWSGYIDAPDPQ